MNLSFSKQINEGDTIVVSLCSYYTEIASLIGSDHYFELINIDIVRENGQSTVPMSALSDICRTLVKILDDTPDAVAYYFCDYVTEIPGMRQGRDISCQSYRNRLFKLLFQKFSQDSKDEWEDREIIIENMETGNLYVHLIYRNRHKDVIAALVDEILKDSDAILSQK